MRACTSRSPLRSSRCSRSASTRSPQGKAGSSSPSGTASAPSSSATATSSSSRAATRSRWIATSPSSLEPLQAQLPRALRRSTARSSSREGGALDFEALQLRLHPAASRVKMLAERDRRRRSSSGTSSAWATATCRGDPFCERRARSSRPSRDAEPPSTSRRPRPTARVAADWFQPLRGRGARRRHGQAARRASTSRTSASCSR